MGWAASTALSCPPGEALWKLISSGLLPERPRHPSLLTLLSGHPQRPESPVDFIWTGCGEPYWMLVGGDMLSILTLPSMSSPEQTCQFPGDQGHHLTMSDFPSTLSWESIPVSNLSGTKFPGVIFQYSLFIFFRSFIWLCCIHFRVLVFSLFREINKYYDNDSSQWTNGNNSRDLNMKCN